MSCVQNCGQNSKCSVLTPLFNLGEFEREKERERSLERARESERKRVGKRKTLVRTMERTIKIQTCRKWMC